MSYTAERKTIINTLYKLSPADRETIFEFYTDIYTDLEQAEHMHDLLDEHIAPEKHGEGKIRSLLIWKLQKSMTEGSRGPAGHCTEPQDNVKRF